MIEAAAGGAGDITVGATLSNEEDPASAAGWSIADRGLERSHDSTGHFTAVNKSLMIRVSGTAGTDALVAPTAADGSVRTGLDTEYTFDARDFGFSGAPGRSLASVKIETLPQAGKGRLTLGGEAVAAGRSHRPVRDRRGRLQIRAAGGRVGRGLRELRLPGQ